MEFAPREDRERKARIQRCLRTGKRVPTADVREGEFYTVLHQGTLAALATARQLTATECLYLLALIAHSHRAQRGPYSTGAKGGDAPGS